MNTSKKTATMDSILNPEYSSKKKISPATTLSIGMILDDKYEIKREIARGGMGIVYEAYHRYVHRKVAIKVILATRINTVQLERFKQEIESYSLLSHPNIIQVYDAGIYENNPYLVMEYIEGIDICKYAKQQKELYKNSENSDPNIYWKLCVQLIYQVALGLDHIHKHSIIHRDIKPSNIIIRTNGSPVIIDLGLAKFLQENANKLTMSGEHVGTPQYMSLEQVQGTTGIVDAQSDVYSLGLVLYELLTGEIAYNGKTLMEIFYKIMEYYPPTPREINPAVPQELEKITMHAIEKQKENRYANAQEFAEALKKYLKDLNTNEITKVDELNDILKAIKDNIRPEVKVSNPALKNTSRKLKTQLDSIKKQKRLQEKEKNKNNLYYIAGVVVLLLVGIIVGSITGEKKVTQNTAVEKQQENISVKPVEENAPTPQETINKTPIAEQKEKNKDPIKEYNTGKMYESHKKYSNAFQCYKNASNNGHIEAQLKLADMYYYGYGTEKNILKAKELYETLAEQGYEKPQLQLGIIYYSNKEALEAEKFLKKAANNGNVEAQLYLGIMYYSEDGLLGNTEKAREYFEKAANNGNAEAKWYLALMHYCKQDYKKARLYFEAIKEDFKETSLYLDLIEAKEYLNNKKYKEAKDAFELIELTNLEIEEAQPVVAEAQLYLGIMYADGLLEQQKENNKKETKVIDTPKAPKRDNKNKILKKGSASKTERERKIQEEREQKQREQEQKEREKQKQKQRDNEKKAREYFEKATNNGNAEAQLYLAMMYNIGKGGEQDLKKAGYYYEKAKNQGNAEIIKVADNMLTKLKEMNVLTN